MTIPNLITMFRLLLVPAVVYALLTGEVGWALAGFVVAGISDGIDGFLARRLGQTSEIGAYLDPLADKLLLVAIFVVLGQRGDLPLWLVVAAVSRDGLIVGGVVLGAVMGRPVSIRPLVVSKANTAVQIVLAALVLSELALGTAFGPARGALVALSGLLTVASAAAYLVGWLKHMAGDVQETLR